MSKKSITKFLSRFFLIIMAIFCFTSTSEAVILKNLLNINGCTVNLEGTDFDNCYACLYVNDSKLGPFFPGKYYYGIGNAYYSGVAGGHVGEMSVYMSDKEMLLSVFSPNVYDTTFCEATNSNPEIYGPAFCKMGYDVELGQFVLQTILNSFIKHLSPVGD